MWILEDVDIRWILQSVHVAAAEERPNSRLMSGLGNVRNSMRGSFRETEMKNPADNEISRSVRSVRLDKSYFLGEIIRFCRPYFLGRRPGRLSLGDEDYEVGIDMYVHLIESACILWENDEPVGFPISPN